MEQIDSNVDASGFRKTRCPGLHLIVTRAGGGSQGKKAIHAVVESAVKELDND